MNSIEKRVLSCLAKVFYRPMGPEELAMVSTLPEDGVAAALVSLRDKGILSQMGSEYTLNLEADFIAGYYQSHLRGYGFVHVGRDRQYYVAPGLAAGARDGDLLLCQVVGRREGQAPAVRVIDFLVRNERFAVAEFQGKSHLGSIREGNKKIMIPSRLRGGAQDGDPVLVAVSEWDGRVASVLGQETKPYMDLYNIAATKGILPAFPLAVEREAEALPAYNYRDENGRLDLRQLEVVTVDGEQSHDLDDGFSLTREANGAWSLGIHIADVAHYVGPHSLLDKEAFQRGSSAYLVDREVPMLPEKLSQDLCSLLPGCDRPALSCLVDVAATGEITSYRFAETVVRSRARLTYSEVAEHSSSLMAQAAELGKVLNGKRVERGASYIELPTTAIKLDGNGVPIRMGPREVGGPRGLVEEFMVLANELAADFLHKEGVSLLYRGNEGFHAGRSDELATYLAHWGYQLAYPPSSKELQLLLKEIAGRPEEILVSRKLARSLHKSRYSWTPLGHYNLAIPFYTHFSSPIRRYSDLFVHRQIKRILRGQPFEDLERDLPLVAEQCSFRERLVQDVEGACMEQKKLQYLAGQGDRIFRGLVAEITNSGPLVWLANTAEGIVVAGERQLYENCQPGDSIHVRIHKLNFKTNGVFFAGVVSEGE